MNETIATANQHHSSSDPAELKERSKELAADTGAVLADRANAQGAKGMSALSRKLDQAANFITETGLDKATDPDSPLQPHHVSKVTGPIREAARYLDAQDPQGLLTDLDGAVHRHPYRAIAVGAACGWVIGKLFSSK